jgi:PIN domain nuclease of toxin-antitoxin system
MSYSPTAVPRSSVKDKVGPTVLDASAVLALMNEEKGADHVARELSGAWISAVNLSEVAAKLVDRGISEDVVDAHIGDLDIEVAGFDRDAAMATAALRAILPRHLSFGDRACLALALAIGGKVLTADREWLNLKLQGATIVSIR